MYSGRVPITSNSTRPPTASHLGINFSPSSPAPPCTSAPPPSLVQFIWIWAPATEAQTVLQHIPQTIKWAGSRINNKRPIHLVTTDGALHACDHTQIQRINLLLAHKGTSLMPCNPPPPQGPNILRALTLQMARALSDKNMGKRAILLQQRIQFLPYHSHTALRHTRRLSHYHTWYTNVTHPHSIICMVFHLYLHLVYVGVTTKALVVCLRKHRQMPASSRIVLPSTAR